MKHGMRGRLILIPAIVMMLGISMQSADESKSVSLRLYLPESSVCVGTTEMNVEMEILNEGESEVVVSPKGFGSAVEFMALYDTADGRPRLESLQTVGDSFAKPVTATSTLNPGRSLKASGSVTLKTEFFNAPGFYKIRLGYSGNVMTKTRTSKRVNISSNWVIFEIRPCEP
ncbi:MAG: hypothetical protein ACRD3Q_13220 [Terriglobales bacterium]